jgi:hypothetical protein
MTGKHFEAFASGNGFFVWEGDEVKDAVVSDNGIKIRNE